MTSLRTIDTWMRSEIAPLAQRIDQTPSVLFQVFRTLGDRNLLALRLPESKGGMGWNEQTTSQFQILIASYSGALAFLATQHQSALRMIERSNNEALKTQRLPDLIRGTIGVGVGFSQLRRTGRPLMTAKPIEAGYLLSGTVPWVTGFGCFEGFICGALLPTNEILMGWVPLRPTNDPPRYRISKPMALTAMASTQTVEVTLNDWPMDMTHVVAVHEADWLRQKDLGNTLHHGFYALGSAKGALRLLEEYQNKFALGPEIREAIAALNQHYQRCESRMFELLPRRRSCPEKCLAAKAEVIHLAGRCAQAAIAMVGGRANRLDHPAQRIYREVLAFTVFGQTPQSQEATLSALSSFST